MLPTTARGKPLSVIQRRSPLIGQLQWTKGECVGECGSFGANCHCNLNTTSCTWFPHSSKVQHKYSKERPCKLLDAEVMLGTLRHTDCQRAQMILQTVALLNPRTAHSNAHRVDAHHEAASHFLKIDGPFNLSFLSNFY